MSELPWQLPDQIGRYEIVGLIGRGGYARVYKARLSGPMGFSKTLAIKVTAAPTQENSKQINALVNEARICGRMQHPNIIEVYEFGRWEDQYFIAMEYIDGIPLDALVPRVYGSGSRLGPGFGLEVLSQACRGLRYAHRLLDDDGTVHQVIHRDLKPANLMLTTSNQVKIMDFGVAKSALSLTKTMEGFTKGTPMYMSPEQITGGELTPASDIYALGIVLFELLTGQRLFAAANLVAVIDKVSRSAVEEDLERHADEIGTLMPLLQRLLAREPGDRFVSAEALLEALEVERERVPAGPGVATIVERYREAPAPAPREATAAKPTAAPLQDFGQAAVDKAWSVVMPALGRSVAPEDDEDQEDLATISLELMDMEPFPGDE